MTVSSRGKHETLVVLLSIAVVFGILVSVLVIFLWRNHPASLEGGLGLQAAIAFCPAFMLVRVVGGVDDTMLALVITGGTVVTANAALYGGFAALAYWGMTILLPRNKRR